MSFTNKTQHYELPQWTGEDKPTFLVDMNNAFAKIDEELYNAGANSDSAQQSAQGANTLAQSVNESLGETNAEVQRINGEVVLLKGTTTTLDNRVQELEGGSGSVSEQLTNLNEKAIINANGIKENQTSIATLQGDMVVAKSDIDTLESQLASGGTKFRFGIDEKGNYGYIKAGADTVTPFKKGAEIYNLGKNTSFNIATMYPDIDFMELTADNFIVCVKGAPYTEADYTDSLRKYTASGFTVTKTYTNGLLTIGGLSQTVRPHTGETSATQNIDYTVYMVLGETDWV